MNKGEKVQLIISSALVILGLIMMIALRNIDLMYYYWLPHLWWVIMMTKFLTAKFPNKNKIGWGSLTVIIGFGVYFGTLWFFIPFILKLFGISTSF